MRTALVLSGGGARAAYQVGVLKAINKILGNPESNPFDILCGTSSGAINAARLACHADDFAGSVQALDALWSQLSSRQIHRVGYNHLFGSAMKLFASFFHSGKSSGRPLSLLDNSPLRELLDKNIELQLLEPMIEQGYVHALCITALGYNSGRNLCFFQGHEGIETWRGNKRQGVRCNLSHDHIMASLALPTLFPSVKLNREYFGDGALRQTAPMSAALHLGADKLFVIGVAGGAGQMDDREKVSYSPSLALVMGQLINSAFIDSLAEDVEMLQRFNAFTEFLNAEQREKLHVRPVKLLVIEPSVRYDKLAAHYVRYLPRSMQTLLRITGANLGSSSNFASYVLFEKEYCQELIRIGYEDGMAQAQDIEDFFASA